MDLWQLNRVALVHARQNSLKRLFMELFPFTRSAISAEDVPAVALSMLLLQERGRGNPLIGLCHCLPVSTDSCVISLFVGCFPGASLWRCFLPLSLYSVREKKQWPFVLSAGGLKPSLAFSALPSPPPLFPPDEIVQGQPKEKDKNPQNQTVLAHKTLKHVSSC